MRVNREYAWIWIRSFGFVAGVIGPLFYLSVSWDKNGAQWLDVSLVVAIIGVTVSIVGNFILAGYNERRVDQKLNQLKVERDSHEQAFKALSDEVAAVIILAVSHERTRKKGSTAQEMRGWLEERLVSVLHRHAPGEITRVADIFRGWAHTPDPLVPPSSKLILEAFADRLTCPPNTMATGSHTITNLTVGS